MLSLQVMTKHRQASPDCPFVKNQSDNVPLLPGGAEERPSERTAGEERTGQDRVPDSGIGSQEEEIDDASHFSSRSSGRRLSTPSTVLTFCLGSCGVETDQFYADPGPSFHFDADPDPTFNICVGKK
jgi:hypothetical protein